ncbi:MAG: serine hydrolase [Deltaproteobacteria bacterium]|nr:serine hydrolase [Deltaproteobacteria bacterium]
MASHLPANSPLHLLVAVLALPWWLDPVRCGSRPAAEAAVAPDDTPPPGPDAGSEPFAPPTDAEAGEPAVLAAPAGIDHETLPERLTSAGFTPPAGGFLACVVELDLDETRARVVAERRYDWHGTGTEVGDWNAASTVKLYAAVAALLRIRALGFEPRATLVFDGTDPDPRFTVTELVQAAVGPSDNLAYDYLVVFTGFDELHEQFLVPENGFEGTVLRVAYASGPWERLGFSRFLRDSPAITIEQDERTQVLPDAHGRAAAPCARAVCTTPVELAEALLRVVLQERLPAERSYGLAPEDLELLRGLLRSTRERGEEVVERLRPSFGPETTFYHKAGFSKDWYTDNVLIDDPDRSRAWVVVLAGYPGRAVLNEAAVAVGGLLAAGGLGDA